jgi:hypothetical protein
MIIAIIIGLLLKNFKKKLKRKKKN